MKLASNEILGFEFRENVLIESFTIIHIIQLKNWDLTLNKNRLTWDKFHKWRPLICGLLSLPFSLIVLISPMSPLLRVSFVSWFATNKCQNLIQWNNHKVDPILHRSCIYRVICLIHLIFASFCPISCPIIDILDIAVQTCNCIYARNDKRFGLVSASRTVEISCGWSRREKRKKCDRRQHLGVDTYYVRTKPATRVPWTRVTVLARQNGSQLR